MTALAIVVALAAAGGGTEGRPKVEYVEVQGKHCLQPVVHAAHVRLADYRAAELRWLDSKHPGVHVSHWDVALLLDPAPKTRGETDDSTVVSDTAHLDDVVGPDATVCFDVGLKENNPSPHEQAPLDTTRR